MKCDTAPHSIRLEVRINGLPCSDPGPIRGYEYVDEHPFITMSPIVLDGICGDLNAGVNVIEIFGYNLGDGMMAGSISQPLVVVEELASDLVTVTYL